MSRLKVVVVGSGIVGSSFSWWLSVAGAEVTVVTRDGPGIGDSATSSSWSWINAGRGASLEYSRFRLRSIRIWDELLARVSGIPVSGNGSLFWDKSRERLEAIERKFSSLGLDCEFLTATRLASVAPYLKELPPFAVLTRSDRAIEPVQAAEALLKASGATVINARVQALIADDSRISGVMTARGRIPADEVVVAAGLGSSELLQSAGLKLGLNSTDGVLAYSSPMPGFLNHLVIDPRFHVRQDWMGRLVVGGRFDGQGAEVPSQVAARRQFDLAMSSLDCKHEPVLDFFTVGRRVLPVDGLPKIGRLGGLGGLYLAVMHSGMTNAAAAGKFGTQEILTGNRDKALKPFSP
ncbi:MAG: FAD-binding oxidoreductase [Albidovulum sp.]|nr:FAD-binding oxidoreductase [Albidovulum sp.]